MSETTEPARAAEVEIPDEAVETLVRAFYDAHGVEPWDKGDPIDRAADVYWMRRALVAALPFLSPQTNTDDELAEAWAAAEEVVPQAIGLNSLAVIIRALAKQRDAQHEYKDHLAERARILTDDRDMWVRIAGRRAEDYDELGMGVMEKIADGGSLADALHFVADHFDSRDNVDEQSQALYKRALAASSPVVPQTINDAEEWQL